jgi:3-oxoacyl-[acyl-carrier protein] reductase
MKLKNKIAVITGGSGQIGYACANLLASEGARIISIVRSNLDTAQSQIKNLPFQELNHLAVYASVKDSLSLKDAVKKLDIEKVDILINSAGRSHEKIRYSNITDDIVDDIIDTNLKGTFYTIREFISLIYKSDDPVIINISSASAQKPNRANVIYAASKSAIDNMTQCMAINMAPKVRVVGVAPGYLENSVSGAAERTQIDRDTMAKNLPLNRIPYVEEVARVVLGIAADYKFLTGVTIPVDCGATIL